MGSIQYGSKEQTQDVISLVMGSRSATSNCISLRGGEMGIWSGEAKLDFCLPEIQRQRRPNNISPKPLNKRHPLSRMSPSCPKCDSVSPEGPQVGIDQIKYLKSSKYLA